MADAEALPFASGAFDLVTTNMVLEHLEQPARVLREVARVLAPGGKFVFVTPNRRHPAVWLLSVFVAARWRRWIARVVEGRAPEHVFVTHYRLNTERAIRGAAAVAGLEARSVEVFPSYPMTRRPIALVALECLWIRSLRWPGLRSFGSNIVGCLERTASSG